MLKKNYSISLVIILNFFYFIFEYYFANEIKSISLFADSLDFLEDSLTNLLAIIGLILSFKYRKFIGYIILLAFITPSTYAVFSVLVKIYEKTIPNFQIMLYLAIGALFINLICTFVLMDYKNSKNFLLHATFLSARNDLIGNLAIIIAAYTTHLTNNFLPDLIVGIIILIINLHSTKMIFQMIKKDNDN